MFYSLVCDNIGEINLDRDLHLALYAPLKCIANFQIMGKWVLYAPLKCTANFQIMGKWVYYCS